MIEAVGAGVAPTRVGERVWLYEAQLGRPFGTAGRVGRFAECAGGASPRYGELWAGASLGVPAMTAHRCVFADGPVDWADGTGGWWCRGGGLLCHPIGQMGWGAGHYTVSAPAKAEVARTAGADHVVNYRNEDVAARIRGLTGGSGVDRVVEVAFGYNLALNERILKPNGAIASYASDAEREPRLPYYYVLGQERHYPLCAGVRDVQGGAPGRH